MLFRSEQAQAVAQQVQATPEVQAVLAGAEAGKPIPQKLVSPAGAGEVVSENLAQPSIVAPRPMAQSDPAANTNGSVLQPQAVIQPQIPQAAPQPATVSPQVSQTQNNNSNEEPV